MPGQPRDGDLRRAGQAGDGVKIARIGDQRGMGQRGKAGPRGAAGRRGKKIAGQTPARVEGHPETGHGLAPQQRLEPQKRGDGPDLIHCLDQVGGADIGHDHIGVAHRLALRDCAGAQARLDIRVGLVDHHRIGVFRPHAGQKGKVGMLRPGAEADRGVILHLSRHKDAVARRKIGQGGVVEVVFAQACPRDAGDQPLGPAFAPRRRTGGDQAFQIAFAGRVVIDATCVRHQRQGRHQSRAKAARAQETVLNPRHGGFPGQLRKALVLRPGPDQKVAPLGLRAVYGAGRVILEAQTLFRAEEALQMRPFPKPHPHCHIAGPVGAMGAECRLKMVHRLFEAAKPVAAGVVPGRRQDHRCGEKLRPGQVPFTPGDGVFICGQAPAGIEGLAEDAGLVARHDRLEPHQGGNGVDRRGTLQQRPGGDRIAQDGNQAMRVALIVMAGALARDRLGVALDDDPGAGVFLLREDQHLTKSRGRGLPVKDRGIALRLVEDEDIARFRHSRPWIEIVVF